MSFDNPLPAFGSLNGLFESLLVVVLTISTPIVVFFLIFAGFQYVTARGNPEKLKVANTSLMYGIVGGVIIMGAFTILAIVRSTVAEF